MQVEEGSLQKKKVVKFKATPLTCFRCEFVFHVIVLNI